MGLIHGRNLRRNVELNARWRVGRSVNFDDDELLSGQAVVLDLPQSEKEWDQLKKSLEARRARDFWDVEDD